MYDLIDHRSIWVLPVFQTTQLAWLNTIDLNDNTTLYSIPPHACARDDIEGTDKMSVSAIRRYR